MKKPDHKLQVKEKCLYCAGRGEMKDQYIRRTWGSDYWTYKKCIHCDGTGKNNKYCVKCKEKLNAAQNQMICSNNNCQRFGLVTLAFSNEDDLKFRKKKN